MHCECYFQTQSDAYIVFRVLDFEVERGEDCMYDYLQVYYVVVYILFSYSHCEILWQYNIQQKTFWTWHLVTNEYHPLSHLLCVLGDMAFIFLLG